MSSPVLLLITRLQKDSSSLLDCMAGLPVCVWSSPASDGLDCSRIALAYLTVWQAGCVWSSPAADDPGCSRIALGYLNLW